VGGPPIAASHETRRRPKGVEILTDATGEPTGVFVESNVIQVLEFTLMKAVPRFTHVDRLRALASRSASTRSEA
jgi:hypothetical protein